MTCITDAGYTAGEQIRAAAVVSVATAKQVAAAVIAIDNANRLIENYRDQRDVSQRAIDIAEAQQNQLATVFWPREEEFLAEFSTPEAVETVEAMGRRYAGRLVTTIAGGFAQKLAEAKCSARRYCGSATRKMFQDLLLARAVAMANARVLGRNIAFAEYQARHDMNLSRRMQAVSLGRGLINQAMSLYQAAGRGFAAAGDTLSTQFNSALEAFGDARETRRQMAQYRDSLQAPAMDQSYAQMPPTTSSWNGQPLPGMTTGFGMPSMLQNTFDPSASNTMSGANWNTSDGNYFQWKQSEQMNNADVGNHDLARTGTAVFPVIGGLGSVIINMDSFPLKYVDHLTENMPYGPSF